MKKRKYWIKEIFRSIQGEGFWAGSPAVFVRFTGCNMWSGFEKDRVRDEKRGAKCAQFCDTDFTKKGAIQYELTALLGEIKKIAGPVKFCVLTGGEPVLQATTDLIGNLQREGFYVAMETNGSLPLDKLAERSFDFFSYPNWICCSPKQSQDKLKISLCDELKIVVPRYHPQNYLDFAEERVREVVKAGRIIKPLYLQPEEGYYFEVSREATMYLIEKYPDWNISVQMHKYLGVD